MYYRTRQIYRRSARMSLSMSQTSAASAVVAPKPQCPQSQNDASILVWEPKVLIVNGLHLWEVENDQDALQFCKKQLNEVHNIRKA